VGAEKYIFPYTDTADIIFNSSLLYEFAVYKNYLNTVFAGITNNNPNINTINALNELVNSFKGIDCDRTPRYSLIREFTGGSTLDLK
jgi:uridine kinase